jgi:hypothetical protein
MKKRVILYGLLAIFVLATVGYRWFVPGSGVNLTNYLRLKTGMNAMEVEDLIGGTEDGVYRRRGTPLRVPNQGWIEYWRGSDGYITLVYDRDGFVVQKDWRFIVFGDVQGRWE